MFWRPPFSIFYPIAVPFDLGRSWEAAAVSEGRVSGRDVVVPPHKVVDLCRSGAQTHGCGSLYTILPLYVSIHFPLPITSVNRICFSTSVALCMYNKCSKGDIKPAGILITSWGCVLSQPFYFFHFFFQNSFPVVFDLQPRHFLLYSLPENEAESMKFFHTLIFCQGGPR